MYLMELDAESLERLRKATEDKQVTLKNPVIVKTKNKQFPLILEKGKYSDYIMPCMVELEPDQVEEVYLIMEFRSTAIYDVLSNTEKYDLAQFDAECFDRLIEAI